MKEIKFEYKIEDLAKFCKLDKKLTEKYYTGLAYLLDKIFIRFSEAIEENKFKKISDYDEDNCVIKGKIVNFGTAFSLDLATKIDESYSVPREIIFYGKDKIATQTLYKIFKNFAQKQNLRNLKKEATKKIKKLNKLLDGWVTANFPSTKYLTNTET